MLIILNSVAFVKYECLDIKLMLLRMQVLGEHIVDMGYSSGCLANELGSRTCRKGCPICHLEETLDGIWKSFTSGENGPGKSH